jgi:hypothetical protein
VGLISFKNLLRDLQIRVAVLKHDIIALANQTRAGRSTHLPVPGFFGRSLLGQLLSVAAGLRPPAGFSGTTSAMSKRFFTLPRL